MSVLQVILLVVGMEAVALVLLLAGTIVTQARKSGARTQRLRSFWLDLLPLALAGPPEAEARLRSSL